MNEGSHKLMLPERQSPRLRGFDYTEPGAYFVTVCTSGRECILGEVVEGKMILSAMGEIVLGCWEGIPDHFAHVRTQEVQIMPNHVHGIIEIGQRQHRMCRGGVSPPLEANKGGETPPLHDVSLGHIVAFFKYEATKKINQLFRVPGKKLFQRSFHDRIIRDDREQFFVEQYIALNPLLWEFDRNNPGSGKKTVDDLRRELREKYRLDAYTAERVLEQFAANAG